MESSQERKRRKGKRKLKRGKRMKKRWKKEKIGSGNDGMVTV